MTSRVLLWRMTKARRREATWGYTLTLPWVLGFVIFTAGPMLASIYFSVTEYSGLLPPLYIGGGNYIEAFAQDRLFWPSLRRTAYYSFVMVPVSLAASLLVAVLLNQPLKLKEIFRTLFFLPSLTPAVAAALLWAWIFQPQVGPINYALSRIGIKGPGWFQSPRWAIPGLMIISLWTSIGGSRMIIFLAGLQEIPQELYDAASIDGAGRWRKFRNITLPLISPTMFFNLITGIIGSFGVFAMAFITTEGGPARATWFYMLHLYYNAFRYFRMGYASSLAWIFFIIVMALTLVQILLSGRWVYYEGEIT